MRNSKCRLYTSRAQAPSLPQSYVSLDLDSVVSLFIQFRHHENISSLNQRVKPIEGALRQPSSPDTRLQQVHHPTITYEVAPVKDLVGTRHDDSAEHAGSGTTDSAEHATFTSSGEGNRRSVDSFQIEH
jgi:hypothetical protein